MENVSPGGHIVSPVERGAVTTVVHWSLPVLTQSRDNPEISLNHLLTLLARSGQCLQPPNLSLRGISPGPLGLLRTSEQANKLLKINFVTFYDRRTMTRPGLIITTEYFATTMFFKSHRNTICHFDP